MELILTDAASIDFDYWRKSGNVKAKRNIENLLQEIKEHPCSGTGHPESLRENLSGMYSCHITKKDRIVYEIVENNDVVVIHSMRGHY